MKKVLLVTFLFLSSLFVNAQTIYSKAFGNRKDKPVIFLHGGPSNSSVYFEATTAQKLADKGFYIIIYDRRGDGRSVDKNAKMNFQEAIDDLNGIYNQYGLTKATLIGFSFGGLVTGLFADKYPEKVQSIVFVSALISQQESYNTILQKTREIYLKNGDAANLKELDQIEKMDTNSLEYRTIVFKHASGNGFFKVEKPNELAKSIYASYDTDPLISKYVKNQQAVPTFWKNEKQKNIDISGKVKKLKDKKIPVYALYGKQDGIFSDKQILKMKNLVGNAHVKYLDNCSHTLFIDQQQEFLSSVQTWLK